VFEAVNERWDTAVAASEHGFQQISLANKCCTTKGGRYVDYITERVTRCLFENYKMRNKRDKTGIHVQSQTIRKHMMVFVNCSIASPIFNIQIENIS
jgi:DNA topoisomerase-2